MQEKRSLRLCSLKSSAERNYSGFSKFPPGRMDWWTRLKKFNEKQNQDKGRQDEIRWQKTPPHPQKGWSGWDSDGWTIVLFIFYQMPLWMLPSARSAQEGPVPPLSLPQKSPLFDLNSRFHFVLFFFFFFCFFSSFPLCLSFSLSLFLTKQYFYILLPFNKRSFSRNGAQYTLIFLKNCFHSPLLWLWNYVYVIGN